LKSGGLHSPDGQKKASCWGGSSTGRRLFPK